MSKASPAITNFNSGEFSPLLEGRIDFERYANGCVLVENWIPTVQGPAIRRAGTRYVAPVKTAANKVHLHPFEYSADTAYVIEFGDQYIRFYTNNGQLVSGGSPVEVATPYTQANLFNADGTCRLRFAQSGDFLYITHPLYQPRVLKRTSSTTFTLDLFEAKGGPFIGTNPDETVTVYGSAETGNITVTASSAIFQSGHVGSLFYIESKNADTIPAWEVNKVIAATGVRRRSDSKYYEAMTTGTGGTVKPVHSSGERYDGDPGILWAFRDAGFGWVKITGYTSATQVSATVLSRLPSGCVGSGNASTRWSHGAWSSVDGWPSSVAFFRERLCFGRNQRVWMSVSAEFSDFSGQNDAGEVTTDMAVSIEVASGEVNDIQWLHPDKQLIAGTAGGEFAVGELSNGDPIGPDNVQAVLQSRFGVRAMQPVSSGSSSLLVMRAGLKLREFTFDSVDSALKAQDVTTISEHITAGGVIDMDYASDPNSVVWCVRSDGLLLGFTWNNEEQVKGWHRHQLGGNGKVESVAVIPRPDGTGDQTWMSVLRTINGSTKRYIEYLENPISYTGDQKDSFYVDSGLTYSGVAATTITGLSHLEGATVDVLADGATHPQVVVTSGAIELQVSATKVQVGLPCPAKLKTVRIEAGGSDGTSQGKTKRMHKVAFRLLMSGTIKVGPNANNTQLVEFRVPGDAMTVAPPLFTGDKLVAWPSGYETEAQIYVMVDQPTPCTLVAIYPQVVTQDSR